MFASDDEKENTMAALTALEKWQAGVAKGSKVARGTKRGSSGTRGAESESETEEEAVVKKGRTLGAVKWQVEDFDRLLSLSEELLPAGKKEWLALHVWFAEWAEENERPLCSAETIEKRYKLLVRTSKLTSSADCPPDVERAHAIEHKIGNRVASGVVRDDDLDDEAAHDDNRQACHLETLHLQDLTSRACEAETEAWALRKELHAVQWELDCESRRADNAERDLWIYQLLNHQSLPVSRHRTPPSYHNKKNSRVDSPTPCSSLPPHEYHGQYLPQYVSPTTLHARSSTMAPKVTHLESPIDSSLYWPVSPTKF
ncbi:hypothetical protein JB92DRAFT_3115359 [Gautieria morchelliformis]|nr:hypothetical protein JB92DRAFT_3115359 [Gautieria morchelliformis]